MLLQLLKLWSWNNQPHCHLATTYRRNCIMVRKSFCRKHGSHVRWMDSTIAQFLEVRCHVSQQVVRTESIHWQHNQHWSSPSAQYEPFTKHIYIPSIIETTNLNKILRIRGVIWGGLGGLGGAVAPPRKKKKERKKEKREKERKREKRKKGTMNNVKLLHMKCCFFQFFNSPVALKNTKIFLPPQEKVEMTPLLRIQKKYYLVITFSKFNEHSRPCL